MEAIYYDIGFLILMGVVAWRTRGDRRAWAWLAVGAASYIVSAAWHRSGGPSPFIMAAACDIGVVIAIYATAKREWEMGLWRIFQAALAVNILSVANQSIGTIPGWIVVQAGLLDICNLAALSWIWINGSRQRVDRADGLPPIFAPLRHLHRIAEALHRERTRLPFWKA